MGDYDGIQEREAGKRKMPMGMAVLFICLIMFGLLYLYLYMPQTTGWNQVRQYEEKVQQQQAEREGYKKDHEAAEPAEHEAAEAAAIGPVVFQENCAVCHGEKLEGGIGPGLRGPKFIYGSKLEDHVRIITNGTEKGMPPFGQSLGMEKTTAVAQYIVSQHAN